jgi:hypothetical protein
VKPLTDAYRAYCNRYAPAPVGDEAPPTAAEELLHLVQDLTVPKSGDRVGSAVGSRLVFTRSADEHAEIKELLTLLGSATGGESPALARDREFRDKLRRNAPRGLGAGNTLGGALWRLFEKSELPVYLHRSLLDTIYFDDAAGVADENADGAELRMRLALVHEFSVDSWTPCWLSWTASTMTWPRARTMPKRNRCARAAALTSLSMPLKRSYPTLG